MKLNNNELMDIFLVRSIRGSLDEMIGMGVISPVPDEFGDYEVNSVLLDTYIEELQNKDSLNELE